MKDTEDRWPSTVGCNQPPIIEAKSCVQKIVLGKKEKK